MAACKLNVPCAMARILSARARVKAKEATPIVLGSNLRLVFHNWACECQTPSLTGIGDFHPLGAIVEHFQDNLVGVMHAEHLLHGNIFLTGSGAV